MAFSPDQKYLVLDYETFSECDLKKFGSYEYSLHPSTEILCVAWKLGTRAELKTAPVRSWSPRRPGDTTFPEFLRALRDPAVILVAHNAYFEQVITANVFGPKYMPSKAAELKIPPKRWLCTASLAAALALPRSLEGACAALRLPVQKDTDGRRLILKWCKPKKPSKKNPSTRHDDPEEFARIVQYCESDIEAEAALFASVPPLNDVERKVWELDQTINLRGFEVDRPLVSKILSLIEEETKVINENTAEMSYGTLSSATQRDALLRWLEAEGVFLPDLRKKTVDDALSQDLVFGDAEKMLRFRKAISKTSTAKYQAFDQRSRSDARLRDILLYWGASTGRWGGRGVQPQNFPRGSIKDILQAIEVIQDDGLEMTRLIYGEPMEVFASCLRGMIVAPEGKQFVVADYAAIEARVIFWVARHEEGLKAYRDGRPMYEEMASDIYGVPTEEIIARIRAGDSKAKIMRQVGKGVMLGCQYQMGGKKFHATCLSQGIEIEMETAELAVRTYRASHYPVVQLWNNINRASIAAVQNPGKKYTVNRTSWWVERGFLWCELPSKRRLAYYGPNVHYEKTPWDEKRPVLSHWGVNPMTKRWELSKTYGGRLVENVVQAISRDLMAWSMLRIDETGKYDIVLSVHDELIAETPTGVGNIREFEELMATLPPWAEGCPVKVEGWQGDRYRK